MEYLKKETENKLHIRGLSTKENVIIKKGAKFLNEYGFHYRPNVWFYHNNKPLASIQDNTLLHKSISENEFISLMKLDSNIIPILKSIYFTIKESYEFRAVQIKKVRDIIFLTREIICLFYNGILVLRYWNKTDCLYRFFDTEGNIMIDKTYKSTSGCPRENEYCDDTDFFRSFFRMKDNHQTKSGMHTLIRILPQQIKTFEIPWNVSVDWRNNGFLILHDKDNNKIKYCDYNLIELNVSYVKCKVIEAIKDYLFQLDEPFVAENDYGSGGAVGLLTFQDKAFHLINRAPKTIEKNGRLLLPDPIFFDNCMNEIDARHHNRPNYINEVKKIDTFELEEGIISLYKFVCMPWAICNTEGKVFYDFNVDKVCLLQDDKE